MGRTMSKLCVLCSEYFEEHGHDAMPIRHGRCCNRCNSTRVIPARLKQQMKQQQLEESRKEFLNGT